MGETSLNENREIEGLSVLSKCPYSWFGILGPFSAAICPNETHFFLIGAHSRKTEQPLKGMELQEKGGQKD